MCGLAAQVVVAQCFLFGNAKGQLRCNVWHARRLAAHKFSKDQAFPRRFNHSQAGRVLKLRAGIEHVPLPIKACFLAANKKHLANGLFDQFHGHTRAGISYLMVAHVVDEGGIGVQILANDGQWLYSPLWQ